MTTTLEHAQSANNPESAGQENTTAPTWADFHALEERVDQDSIRRNTWTLAVWVFAAIALIFSMIGIGLSFRAADDAKRNANTAVPPATVPPVGLARAASPGPVTLSDFRVQPTATAVAAGNVTFQIANAGKVQHELLIFRSDLAPSAYPMKGGNIDEEAAGITKVSDGDNLDPGTSQTRTVDLSQPGTYLFVCNLPGHFKAGMYSVVTVK